MKKIFKLFIALIISIICVACGDNHKKEITVYTALEENLIENYVKEFNKSYPDIKLNIISTGGGEIIAKLIAEKDNPQADVVWSTSDLPILNQYNLLHTFKPERFNEIPKMFKDNSENPKWFGISAWMMAIGVNELEITKITDKPVTSYYDLLNSKLKRQVLMANPGSSSTGYLTVNTFFNIFGEEKAWEYMDKLNENIQKYTSSGNAPVQIVGRGEGIVGFIPAYQGIAMEKEGVLPLKVVFPQEGIGWELEECALVNKKNIKDEAKIFLNWVLSDEALKIHSQTRGFITIPKYRVLNGYPENIQDYLKERNFELELKNRTRILKEWEERYGKGDK